MSVITDSLKILVAVNDSAIYYKFNPLITKNVTVSQWTIIFASIITKNPSITAKELVSSFIHDPKLYEHELSNIDNSKENNFYCQLVQADYRAAGIDLIKLDDGDIIGDMHILIYKLNNHMRINDFLKEYLSLVDPDSNIPTLKQKVIEVVENYVNGLTL